MPEPAPADTNTGPSVLSTACNCSLFNNNNYINSGVESLVYDVGDYVYKVKKHGYTLQKDLENSRYIVQRKPFAYCKIVVV